MDSSRVTEPRFRRMRHSGDQLRSASSWLAAERLLKLRQYARYRRALSPRTDVVAFGGAFGSCLGYGWQGTECHAPVRNGEVRDLVPQQVGLDLLGAPPQPVIRPQCVCPRRMIVAVIAALRLGKSPRRADRTRCGACWPGGVPRHTTRRSPMRCSGTRQAVPIQNCRVHRISRRMPSRWCCAALCSRQGHRARRAQLVRAGATRRRATPFWWSEWGPQPPPHSAQATLPARQYRVVASPRPASEYPPAETGAPHKRSLANDGAGQPTAFSVPFGIRAKLSHQSRQEAAHLPMTRCQPRHDAAMWGRSTLRQFTDQPIEGLPCIMYTMRPDRRL